MSYIVPRDKPSRCYKCPFMDKITYDCKLMYGDDYPEKAYWDYNEAIDDYNNFKVVSEYDIANTPTVIKENK